MKKITFSCVLMVLLGINSVSAQFQTDLCGNGLVIAETTACNPIGEFGTVFEFQLDTTVWTMSPNDILVTIINPQIDTLVEPMPNNYLVDISNQSGNLATQIIYNITIESGAQSCTVALTVVPPNCNTCEIDISYLEMFCDTSALGLNDPELYLLVNDVLGTGTSYSVNYQGVQIGTGLSYGAYNSFTITAPAGTFGGVFVYDDNDLTCFDEVNIAVPDCSDSLYCGIDIPIAEVYCDGGNTFIDFEVNPGMAPGNNFDVYFAGVPQGTFSFGNVFYTIQVPNNPGQLAGLYVVSDIDPDCNFSYSITIPDCLDSTSCEIDISSINITCDSSALGTFPVLELVVNDVLGVGSTYSVDYLGSTLGTGLSYGTNYSFPLNTAVGTGGVYVYDDNDSACFDEVSMTIPDCTQTNCSIDITSLNIECDSILGATVPYIFIEVNIATASNGTFTIFVNGAEIGSSLYYGMEWFIPANYPAGSSIVVTVQDEDDPNCLDELTVTVPNCDSSNCLVDILVPGASDLICNSDGSFDLQLNFDILNDSGTGFDIFVDSTFYEYSTNYPSAGNPYILENLIATPGQTIQIIVADNDNSACADYIEIQAPNCNDTTSCGISIPVTEVYCDGGNTYIDFEVNPGMATGNEFNVNFAGVYQGTFAFGNAFYTIQVPNNAGQSAGLYIYSNIDPACNVESQITLPDCEGDCIYDGLVASVDSCANGEAYLEIDFVFLNLPPNPQDFEVSIDGISQGIFNELDLPITGIGPVLADDVTEFLLTLNPPADTTCIGTFGIGPFSCPDSTECFIDSPEITFVDCIDSSSYTITIDFDYFNVSTLGFNISPDSNSPNFIGMGDYLYSDLPITLGPFSSGDTAIYNVEIVDLESTAFFPCFNEITLPVISCMLPGDTDGDFERLANNHDVLRLGLAYGATGPERFDQGIDYDEKAFIHWSESFSDNRNYGHADCDGNGIINADDLLAIDVNYELTPAIAIPSADPAAPALWIDLPEDELVGGSTVTLPITLGTSGMPVTDIYGLAFSVLYESDIIEPGTMTIDFGGSMMGASTEILSQAKVFEYEEQIDIAVTRNDLVNISGYGDIAYATFVLIENIEGKLEIAVPISFEIANLTAITSSDIALSLDTPTELGQVVANVQDIQTNSNIQISPNPSTDYILIENDELSNFDIELYNSNGQVVFHKNIASGSTEIDIRTIPSGIYFIVLKNEESVYSDRIIIQNK